MARILLLRSGASEDGGESLPPGVEVLATHAVACRPEGVGEAVAAARGIDGGEEAPAWTLVVTSQSTVRCVSGEGESAFFGRSWGAVLAAGRATARALEEAGASRVEVPDVPGAAGIVPALLSRATTGASLRVLWPRGSDADAAPLAPVRERASLFLAPVVYEKRPVPPPRDLLDRLACGAWDSVAVSSLAALDVLLAALAEASIPPPNVRWGTVGPATARAFAARGLPEPVVPSRPRLSDLLARLTETGQR